MLRFLFVGAVWLHACLGGGAAVAAGPASATAVALGGVAPAGTTSVGFGSAFFIDGLGDLVTAEHVVSACQLLRIAAPDLKATDAILAAVDHRHDLALLHVAVHPPGGLGLRHLPPFDASASQGLLLLSDPEAAPKLGFLSASDGALQDVGYPGLASASPSFLPMTPLGVAIASDHDWRIFLQGGAVAGQSGSPVFDGQGRIIGMFSQAVLRPRHRPVAIPGVGEAWDAALAVPSTMIVTFLSAHGLRATDAGSTASAQARATVRVFCFM